jgi:hypothetical protein
VSISTAREIEQDELCMRTASKALTKELKQISVDMYKAEIDHTRKQIEAHHIAHADTVLQLTKRLDEFEKAKRVDISSNLANSNNLPDGKEEKLKGEINTMFDCYNQLDELSKNELRQYP